MRLSMEPRFSVRFAAQRSSFRPSRVQRPLLRMAGLGIFPRRMTVWRIRERSRLRHSSRCQLRRARCRLRRDTPHRLRRNRRNNLIPSSLHRNNRCPGTAVCRKGDRCRDRAVRFRPAHLVPRQCLRLRPKVPMGCRKLIRRHPLRLRPRCLPPRNLQGQILRLNPLRQPATMKVESRDPCRC